MEAIKFLEETKNVNLFFDDDADTLYLSVGEPRDAIGVDVGDGTTVRYDEKSHEVVGVTMVGLRNRFIKELKTTL